MTSTEYRKLKDAIETMTYFSYWLWETKETGKGRRKKVLHIHPPPPTSGMAVNVAEFIVVNFIKEQLKEYENTHQ
mgnify:CR=1 FL=1